MHPDNHIPNDLDAARHRAADAATRTATLRADLVALNQEARPARAAIRARDEAASALAELREQDAQHGADALAAGRKAVKPDPAIAAAERALAEAERDTVAGGVLLARLRARADAIRAALITAEAAQGEAAASLVVAEHRAALADWDTYVQSGAAAMARLDAISTAAARLRVTLPGGVDATSLRRALSESGLVLTTWGAVGLARPSWLHGPDAAAVAKGSAALLAAAGLAADHFVRQEHTPIVLSSPIRSANITVTPGAAQPEVMQPPNRQVVRFDPYAPPSAYVRFAPD